MSIFEEYGLEEVVNASGRMTKLGVSCIHDEVASALVEASQSYVVIEDLYEKVGKAIGKIIASEDACVTSSASSGLALSIASLICKDSLQKIRHFRKILEKENQREVIMLKGHNVDFGAPMDLMVEMGGGKVVEVGYANGSTIEDIRGAINENTLAILYVKSHHCVQKNMVAVEDVIKLANQIKIPMIVDAAAEENLSQYISLGADFVCYSGAKAISGPSSGFVACKREEDAANMRLQYKGIGRVMKVGKENIVGLLKAIERYQANNGYVPNVTLEELNEFASKVNQVSGLKGNIIKDEAGREIYRCKIDVDPNEYGIDAISLVKELENYKPHIFTRDYQANLGSIAIDPRPLNHFNELKTILKALVEIKGK